MKEKILIIGQLPPPFHGSNVMTKVMLAALQKQGYENIFIDKSFAKSIETLGKFSLRKILRVPVLAIEILIACLFKRPAMCIYFIAVGKLAFFVDALLLLLLRLCNMPYILRFGGKSYYELQNEGYIWHFLVSSSLSNALGGIVLGEKMRSDVNSFIPDEQLIYVPNGMENHNYTLQKNKNSSIQILFLSNLHPSKGPFEVLKAANIVVKQNADVHFVLAGADSSPVFTQQLRSYITQKMLDEYVTMPGRVFGEEKEKLFATSDIFVFPSYFKREVSGNVNIEAMSWGLPVISSAEGAISEIVKNGVTGFIVNPKSSVEIADKILTLVKDPSLRREMGIKGRENFELKYTLEAHAMNLDGAIKFFSDLNKCDKIK